MKKNSRCSVHAIFVEKTHLLSRVTMQKVIVINNSNSENKKQVAYFSVLEGSRNKGPEFFAFISLNSYTHSHDPQTWYPSLTRIQSSYRIFSIANSLEKN